MSPLRVLRGFMFGALGGVLGWVFVELLPLPYPFQPGRYETPGSPIPPISPTLMGLLGAAVGMALGGFLGVSEGISEGTAARFKRAFWTFLLVGPLGGYVGLYFGQLAYTFLGGQPTADAGGVSNFFMQILARSLGWMLFGLFLGVAMGVPGLSSRRMWNGAVGGGIGGFLGGFTFQVLVYTRLFQGPQVRLLGFVIIGAAIGFFINLVAEAMKRVWVKVLIGRNEGREHVLDTPIAYVGRDELADVPVFLDPMVPKRMASFRLNGGRYALYPESAGLQITVNGQALTPGQVLRDGDAIQFGRVTLAYNEKATATGSQRPVDSIALADFGAPAMPSGLSGATPLPTTPGVCQYCGQMPDVNGACACSVGVDPGAAGGYGAANSYAGDPGYGGVPAYGPDPGYAPPAYDGGYAPAGDPAYAATVMDGGGYAPPAGGGPALVGMDGPYMGQVIPLAGMDLPIGRDPSMAIALVQDGTASRRHARLFAANGTWVVRDEGSSNGTWVNGVRIQEQPLFPGDVIRIGASQFRFDA